MRSLELRWFELAIRAELPASGPLLPFLTSYFEPIIRVVAPSGGPYLATLHAHLGQPPAGAPTPADGAPITVDRSGGFLRCDGRVVDDGAVRWIWLTPSRVLVRLERRRDPHALQIDLFSPDEEALRVPVLRIVEDVLLDEAQRRGAVVLHASAVVAGGRAVLFLGNKGAGKTTALLRALEGFETALLANDNVCLIERENGYVARGWPAFLKVEAGTVASTGPLRRDLPADCEPLLADDRALWDVYEKVPLYPAQGAARFGAPMAIEAPLGALVFPRFRPDRAPTLEPVSPEEIAGGITELLQGVFNPNHTRWMGAAVDEETVLAAAGRFAERLRDEALPLYSLSWAPSLADLLARVAPLATARHPRPGADRDGTQERWPAPPPGPEGATLTFKSRR